MSRNQTTDSSSHTTSAGQDTDNEATTTATPDHLNITYLRETQIVVQQFASEIQVMYFTSS